MISKKDNDFNNVQRKNLHFSKKANEYRNHQKISYNHTKNIIIHMKNTLKQMEAKKFL